MGTPVENPADSVVVASPALALRWLGWARRGTLLVQVIYMLATEAGTHLHLHSPLLLAGVAGWALWDAALALYGRARPVRGAVVVGSTAVDLAVLTFLLVLSGGAHSPLLFGYLAWIALLAMVLRPREAWVVCAVAIALEFGVVRYPVAGGGVAADVLTPIHLFSHVVTFDFSAITITWVVARLSAALRERGVEEANAQRDLATTQRLAALGTLAAGVAHELGTPLGTIQLVAEQIRARPGDAEARIPSLLQQVARCRDLLDRLRGREVPGEAQCPLELEQWVAEWQRAHPAVAVTLPATPGRLMILGAGESWRAAVWVALDNAVRAGATRVAVSAQVKEGAVDLALEDDGRGVTEEALQRAGEPFWTGSAGTGLGLFVSRSFAQSVGGDVVLESAGTGARTRILIPRVVE